MHHCPVFYWLLSLLLLLLVAVKDTVNGEPFLILVPASAPAGTKLFQAASPALGTGARFHLDNHRSGSYVRRLLHIDTNTGDVTLKRQVDCRGAFHPNPFHAYIECSGSADVTFLIIPLRIHILGEDACYNTNSVASPPWAQATQATIVIPIEETQPLCLRHGQFVASLSSLLPYSVRHKCRIRFEDLLSQIFQVEEKGGDLVSSRKQCLQGALWNVNVSLQMRCDRGPPPSLSDGAHQLKVVLRRKLDTEQHFSTHRLRREMLNQVPQFAQSVYTAEVPEEKPAGLPVATLLATDPEGSLLTYSMVSVLDARSQALFSIEPHSGRVATTARLDREMQENHLFRITAADNGVPSRTATATLQIHVVDGNDHAPIFEHSIYEATIREGVAMGATVLTLRATDQDFGSNAQVRYRLLNAVETDEVFRVDEKSGALATRLPLDRERTDRYELLIQAEDGAGIGDRHSATATVRVTVTDDNDNYPQFSERNYVVQVPEDEDWTRNPVIARITATDLDEGSNSAIRYALIGGNTHGQFAIDATSGDVSLLKPLDYEVARSFRLTVRAQDGGIPSRSNTTQLLVTVVDINDNAPRFYTTLFQESILESSPAGSSVVRAQAYDADDGDNAAIHYSLIGAPPDVPLEVDEKTGWIRTSRTLDREESHRFHFQVLASDDGHPPLSATASVVITVQDVNDNDPSFEKPSYDSLILEDAPPGTPVLTVSASDRDENPRLHYSIVEGNARNRFAIATQNGQGLITVAQPLDFKQERMFVLTVTATDAGGRSDSAIVHINITDANTHAPVFEGAPYSISVFEDAPVGTTILVVSAGDADSGVNADITYTLSADSPPEFVLQAQSGAVVLVKSLDRESTAGYLLTVTATDGGIPQLSDTTDVEILVADVNDNAPVFDQASYYGKVPEDALVGTSILQISAADSDSGLNGRLRYTFQGGDNGSGAFTVDPTSGVIRTNKPLDRESVAQYELVALAVDKGSPEMSTSVTVIVKIEDVNDSPPIFESDRLILFVSENAPLGSTVGSISAVDPDEGPNAVVSYSIVGGEDADSFTLASRPGSDSAELLTRTELDYESSKKRYFLLVRAASPPLRTDVQVEIQVEDINDNAPSLKDFSVMLNNYKDFFPTGNIGRIPAFDADVTDKLHYRIVSGNKAELVILDELTGQLTLSPKLNTNVPLTAKMHITASDGVNTVEATMTLEVRLVTNEMLFNSVTLRLADMTQEAFLSPIFQRFIDAVAALVPCPSENVFLFGLQEDNETPSDNRILNVSFSVREPNKVPDSYFAPQFLQERLYLHRKTLAQLATVQILPFDDTLCVREPCLNLEQCLSVLKFGNASNFVTSPTLLFRSIRPVTTFACRCPSGFTGMRESYGCDTELNLCYSSPCRNNGKCKRREGGYTCVCPDGFSGSHCEIQLSKATCISDLCSSGSTCSSTIQGGIRCQNCSLTPSEFVTPFCQLRARSFIRGASLTFPALRQRNRLHIKLSFATREPDGILFYNGRYSGRHDFLSLEIKSSELFFTFSLGGGATRLSTTIPGGISDGQWHTVEIAYFNRTATLSIDDCDVALAFKFGEQLGRKWKCAAKATEQLEGRCSQLIESCHRFLDLTGPLQFGSISPLGESVSLETAGFEGCISDVYIDYQILDLASYVSESGTTPGCQAKQSLCRSAPCRNEAKCTEGWGSFHCHCLHQWGGRLCDEEVGSPWHFEGSGVIIFQRSPSPVQLPWSVSLSFRTLQTDGILLTLRLAPNKTALLRLWEGRPQYWWDGHRVPAELPAAVDGQWHHLEAKWMAGELWLAMDHGRAETTARLDSSVLPQGLLLTEVIVGGVQPDIQAALPSLQPFIGCIQDIRVSNIRGGPLIHPSRSEGVVEGCTPDSKHIDSAPKHKMSGSDCRRGQVGLTCIPACQLEPCENNSTCKTNLQSVNGYQCLCDQKYAGEYCEEVLEQSCPASWWGRPICGPCTCDIASGFSQHCNQRTGECSCLERHYHPNDSSRCLPCLCHAIGALSADCHPVSGQCLCRSGVIGRQCNTCPHPFAEVTTKGCQVVYDACPRSESEGMIWERAPFSKTAIQSCPPGTEGKASRMCDRDDGWGPADLFNCTSAAFIPLRRLLHRLEVGELEMTQFVAVRLATDLRSATNDSRKLYGADVLVGSQLLLRLLVHERLQGGMALAHTQDRHFVQNIVWTLSSLLEPNTAGLWLRLEALVGRGPEEMLEALDAYLIALALSQKDTYTASFEITTTNLVLGLDVIQSTTIEGLTRFPEDTYTPRSSYKQRDTPSEVPAIQIPKYDNYPEDLETFDHNTHFLLPLKPLKLHEGDAVVSYAIFRSLGMFLPMRLESRVSRRWGLSVHPKGPLVSMALVVPPGEVVESTELSFEHPYIQLSFSLPHDSPTTSPPQCVFWKQDELLTDDTSNGLWSRSGCKLQGWGYKKKVLEVNCSCHHLSTFAVLVAEAPAPHAAPTSVAEEVATYIGATLALLLLLLVLLALIVLRGPPACNASAIQRHLVAVLLIVQILYLAALKARVPLLEQQFVCKLIAMGLHYLWLSAFCWLLVDALHLFRMLHELRDVNHGRMRGYVTLGYGAPALVLALALAVRADHYGNVFFCWLSLYEGAVWALVGPICISAGATLVLLILSLRAALALPSHVASLGSLRLRLALALLLLPLAGTTWALALMSASEPLPLLRYFLALAQVSLSLALAVGLSTTHSRLRPFLMSCCTDRKAGIPIAPVEEDRGFKKTAGASTVPRPALAYRTSARAQEIARRNMGISTASTTSRSTCRTGSSPYRSEAQLRHLSTSTSNYQSGSEEARDQPPSHVEQQDVYTSTRRGSRRHHNNQSDSDESEGSLERLEQRGLELASSHSSDEDYEIGDEESSPTNERGNICGSKPPPISTWENSPPTGSDNEVPNVYSPKLLHNQDLQVNSEWGTKQHNVATDKMLYASVMSPSPPPLPLHYAPVTRDFNNLSASAAQRRLQTATANISESEDEEEMGTHR